MVATYIASKLGDHKTLERIYKACSWFIIATIALLPIAIIGLIIFFVYVAVFCKWLNINLLTFEGKRQVIARNASDKAIHKTKKNKRYNNLNVRKQWPKKITLNH